MKYKKLQIKHKCLVMLATGVLSSITLVGCGNKELIDFNKNFNAIVEINDEVVSIAGIKEYADYDGTQVQIVTDDGLRILTSTHQTQLLNSNSNEELMDYVKQLTNDSENIMNYNELQGIELSIKNSSWNKNLLDLNFSYDNAIILSDNGATIVAIKKWRDYEDDKIQIQLEDGTYILTNADKIKLVNTDSAQENSLENYARSLVGNDGYVNQNSKELVKTK
ncbi:MAG: hypothetical protein KH135_04865 [Firmicutes bacterium]|nr:hypothetical protein [Bacillota bacterium]